jgi:tRNA-2-methylthio-N6-dimethylallyladenosine synthase
MHEFKYNMAYIAQYSPRPGAASSRWADDVPHTEKKRRFHQLSDDMMKYTLDHNQKMIGKIYRILVTGKDRKKGYMTGLTEGRIIVRFPSNDLSLIGNFIRVKITSAATMSTEGKWMQQHEPALS